MKSNPTNISKNINREMVNKVILLLLSSFSISNSISRQFSRRSINFRRTCSFGCVFSSIDSSHSVCSTSSGSFFSLISSSPSISVYTPPLASSTTTGSSFISAPSSISVFSRFSEATFSSSTTMSVGCTSTIPSSIGESCFNSITSK